MKRNSTRAEGKRRRGGRRKGRGSGSKDVGYWHRRKEICPTNTLDTETSLAAPTLTSRKGMRLNKIRRRKSNQGE